MKLKNIVKYIFVLLFILLISYQTGKMRNPNNNTKEYTFVRLINGGFGNHENIVWLMSNQYDLQYGKTYLAGFANVIPRKIWQEKPIGAGPTLKNFIYPYSYNIGEAGNSSLTTGFFAELMMNFGFFGVFIFSLLYGIFMKFLYLKLVNKSLFISLYLLYTLIIFSSQIFYAEFLGFFSRYLITSIPFIILIFFNKKYKSQNVLHRY